MTSKPTCYHHPQDAPVTTQHNYIIYPHLLPPQPVASTLLVFARQVSVSAPVCAVCRSHTPTPLVTPATHPHLRRHNVRPARRRRIVHLTWRSGGRAQSGSPGVWLHFTSGDGVRGGCGVLPPTSLRLPLPPPYSPTVSIPVTPSVTRGMARGSPRYMSCSIATNECCMQ